MTMANHGSQDQRFAAPDEQTSRQLRAMIELLRAFRELAPAMPVSYIITFLTVALKPGGGSTDYMKELDTVQPVMSRILQALANRGRHEEDGLDMISMLPDPLDLRRSRATLTPKGRQLLAKVLREIERMR